MSETEKPKRKGRKGKGNIPIEVKAEMVAALPLADGCMSQVARDFGVSPDVVERAAKSEAVAELAEVKKEQIAQKLGMLVDKLASRFLKIADEATLDNKASTLLGIAADKHRLYTDQPTTITESRDSATLREEALKLLEQYKNALGGDEVKAREMLAADAPTLSRWVN